MSFNVRNASTFKLADMNRENKEKMPTDGNKFMATHKCLRTFLSEKFSAHMTSERLYATVCMSSESSDKKQLFVNVLKEKTIRIINFLHHAHVYQCVYYILPMNSLMIV